MSLAQLCLLKGDSWFHSRYLPWNIADTTVFTL